MSKVSRFLLLADIAVLVFIRFPLSYAWVFYLLAALLVPLTGFFYFVTFHVSLRHFIRLTGDRDAVFIGTASFESREQRAIETGEGSVTREKLSTSGRLGLADNQICFAARKGGVVEIMVSVPQNAVKEVRIEKGTTSSSRGRVAIVLSNGDSLTFSSVNCIAVQQRIVGIVNGVKS